MYAYNAAGLQYLLDNAVNGVEYTQIAIDGELMTIDADKNVTVQ